MLGIEVSVEAGELMIGIARFRQRPCTAARVKNVNRPLQMRLSAAFKYPESLFEEFRIRPFVSHHQRRLGAIDHLGNRRLPLSGLAKTLVMKATGGRLKNQAQSQFAYPKREIHVVAI